MPNWNTNRGGVISLTREHLQSSLHPLCPKQLTRFIRVPRFEHARPAANQPSAREFVQTWTFGVLWREVFWGRLSCLERDGL